MDQILSDWRFWAFAVPLVIGAIFSAGMNWASYQKLKELVEMLIKNDMDKERRLTMMEVRCEMNHRGGRDLKD